MVRMANHREKLRLALNRLRSQDPEPFSVDKYAQAFGPSARLKAEEVLRLLKEASTPKFISAGCPVILSVGGADATEAVTLLERHGSATHAIVIEAYRELADRARENGRAIASTGKHLDVIQGDAASVLSEAVSVAERYIRHGKGDFLLVSCHAVLHELYDRGIVEFDPLRFFSTIISANVPAVWLTYREPGVPDNWPDKVLLKTDCAPEDLLELCDELRTRHSSFKTLPGPYRVGRDRICLPKLLAFELLCKLFYLDDLKHELEERSTAIQHDELLSVLADAMQEWLASSPRLAHIASVRNATQSFHRLWDEYEVSATGTAESDRRQLIPPDYQMRVTAWRLSDSAAESPTKTSEPLRTTPEGSPSGLSIPVVRSYQNAHSVVSRQLAAGRHVQALLSSLAVCPSEDFRSFLQTQYSAFVVGARKYAEDGDYVAWQLARRRLAEALDDKWKVLVRSDIINDDTLPNPCRVTVPDAHLVVLDQSSVDRGVSLLSATRRLAISGVSGGGKSSLAIQVAYQCAFAGLFREVFWVDLRSGAHWARVFGAYQSIHPGCQPQGLTPAEQAEYFYDLLVQREGECLLILDNMDTSPDQTLKDFVTRTPAPCAVLATLTSETVAVECGFQAGQLIHASWELRTFLPLMAWLSDEPQLRPLADGARRMLSVVESGFAAQFMHSPRWFRGEFGSDAELDAAANAADLCSLSDYNPKLLLYALAELRKGAPLNSLSSVCAADEDSTLRYSTERWECLSPDARSLAALLLPHDEGVHLDALSALTGCDLQRVRVLVGELQAQNLVRVQPDVAEDGGVVRCHSIDKRLMEWGTGGHGFWNEDLAERVLQYFRDPGKQQDRLRHSGNLLLKAMHLLKGRDPREPRVRLVVSLHEAIKRGGHWLLGAELGEAAYEEAGIEKMTGACVRIDLDVLAWIAFWRGDYAKCNRYLSRAEALGVTDADRRKLERRRAHCLVYLGDYERARRILEELLQDVSSHEEKVDLLHVSSQLEFQQGMFGRARECAEQAFQLATIHSTEGDNMQKEQSVALYYKAEAQRLLGDIEGAMTSLYEASDICSRMNRIPGLAHDMLGLAECMVVSGLGDPAYVKAGRLATESLRLFDNLGVWFKAQRCIALLSRVRARALLRAPTK